MTDEAAPGLLWTVRSSFIRYVSSLPDGRGIIYRGATASAEGITFAVDRAEIDPATGNGTVSFAGTVHFVGHFGMLSVRIGLPAIEVTDGAGSLTIASDDDRLTLATFTATYERIGDRGRWRSEEVLLTEDGSEIFGGSYAPGEPLDPFTAEVLLGDRPTAAS